jgi:hypothetical protein
VEDGHPVRYPDLGALQEAYWQGKAFSGYLPVYEDGPSVAVSENSLILPYEDAELIAQWNDAALPHFTLTADSGHLAEQLQHDIASHRGESYLILKRCYIKDITIGHIALRQVSPDTSHIINAKVWFLLVVFTCPYQNVGKQVGERTFWALCRHVACRAPYDGSHHTVNNMLIRFQKLGSLSVGGCIIASIYQYPAALNGSHLIM